MIFLGELTAKFKNCMFYPLSQPETLQRDERSKVWSLKILNNMLLRTNITDDTDIIETGISLPIYTPKWEIFPHIE